MAYAQFRFADFATRPEACEAFSDKRRLDIA
jgi:hypothetical protein